MERKKLFLADWTICSILVLLAWHYQMLFEWRWIAQVVLVYILFLRLNLCALLYEREKKSVWSLLLLLILIGCMPEVAFPLSSWRYAAYGWFVGVPVIMYLANRNRQTQEKEEADVVALLGKYMFDQAWSRKCLSYFAVFGVAFMLSEQMDYSLSMFGVYVLPIVAYKLLNGESGSKPANWEYAVLACAMILFVYSQHEGDNWKTILLAVSTGLVLVACVNMYMRTRKFTLTVTAFCLSAFVLPVLTLGYNIYAVRDAWIVGKYTDKYIHRGVMLIESPNGYGIRDRYGIVIPTQYEDIMLTDWEQHLIKAIRRDGDSETIDISNL